MVSEKQSREDVVADTAFAAACTEFQKYYALYGKEEWWWIMDDSIDAIGAQLNKQGYCIIDGFLTADQAQQLHKEVAECHAEGRLEGGGLVNGKLPSSDDAKYADRATRGDVIGWFDSTEDEWPHGRGLEGYLLKLGTLVSELQRPVPHLAKITSRSKAMAACYPGGGARYVKHVDNDGKHPLCKTRLLTALIYLNGSWHQGDGGELAIFRAEDEHSLRRTVPPLQNRLLLFWSDWRTPHEVRPAQKPRYSVTVWLLDNTQKVEETAQPAIPANLPPPSTAGECDYEWQQAATGWDLKVRLPEDMAAECPVLDISDVQVRVASSSGEPLLCLPLPCCGDAVPKWSRKRRQLTVHFSDLRCLADSAGHFAAQLASQGWGMIDGFLPGPEADELRQFVLAERAAGKLQTGRNAHEGPRKADNAEGKSPMKNDEYNFLEGDPPAVLRGLTRRCNQLLAKLLVADQLPLHGKNLLQGHPMLAIYPGTGAAYGRHLDSTVGGRGANGRVLTLVLYLNPFWKASHGGCLKLLQELADKDGIALEPLHGRLVGFLCQDQNPHEVLPCWADRVAVTVWYYDGDRLTERRPAAQ